MEHWNIFSAVCTSIGYYSNVSHIVHIERFLTSTLTATEACLRSDPVHCISWQCILVLLLAANQTPAVGVRPIAFLPKE